MRPSSSSATKRLAAACAMGHTMSDKARTFMVRVYGGHMVVGPRHEGRREQLGRESGLLGKTTRAGNLACPPSPWQFYLRLPWCVLPQGGRYRGGRSFKMRILTRGSFG